MKNERHPYSLIGINGNAYAIIGYTINAMKECGYSIDAQETYKSECFESHSYDELLQLSIMMVDNCNKLSGYDNPFQQFYKGKDGLEYVNPHAGVTNRREKLIDEGWGSEYLGFDDVEEPDENSIIKKLEYHKHELDNNKDIDYEDEEESDDFYRLRTAIYGNLKFTLNNLLADGYKFTRQDIKRILFDDSDSILNDPETWERLEEEIPLFPLNEDIDKKSFAYVKRCIQNRLIQLLNGLICDEVKFSKYDIYQALLYCFSSTNSVLNQLDEYIPEE